MATTNCYESGALDFKFVWYQRCQLVGFVFRSMIVVHQTTVAHEGGAVHAVGEHDNILTIEYLCKSGIQLESTVQLK